MVRFTRNFPALIIAAVALCASDAGAQSRRTPERPEASHSSSADINQLLRDLAGRNFEKRQAAEEALRAFGTGIAAKLGAHYRNADDLETRLRIQTLAQEAYFAERVNGDEGFLGISSRQVTYHQESRLELRCVGFEVIMVIPNAAAHFGGLREGDLIVSINGEPFVEPFEHDGFRSRIISTSPGQFMTFGFYRRREFKRLRVPIGPRADASNGFSTTDYSGENVQAYIDAVTQFPAWWKANFANRDDSNADASRGKPTPYPFSSGVRRRGNTPHGTP